MRSQANRQDPRQRLTLDDDIRDERDVQARSQGVGLATLLRNIATQATRDARHGRTRPCAAVPQRVTATRSRIDMTDRQS